jgi:hypothetical protein
MKITEILNEFSPNDFFGADPEQHNTQIDRQADDNDRRQRAFREEQHTADMVTEEWLMNLHVDDIEHFAESLQADVPNEQPAKMWIQYGDQLNTITQTPDEDSYGYAPDAFTAYDQEDHQLYQLLESDKMVKWSALKAHFEKGLTMLNSEALTQKDFDEAQY